MAVRVFPGHPQQVASARRWAAALAAARGATPGEARLVTSELVTNAIVHTRSSQRGGIITVVIVGELGRVTIHVHDLGTSTGQMPVPRPPAANPNGLAEGNRGLWIVAALGADWGTRLATHCPASQPGDPATTAGGCCTWCTLACQPTNATASKTTSDQVGMASS